MICSATDICGKVNVKNKNKKFAIEKIKDGTELQVLYQGWLENSKIEKLRQPHKTPVRFGNERE